MASARTGIEWTDATWNPVTGCDKVSAGCKFCYAETLAERFRGQRAFPHGFDLTLHEQRLDQPLRWRQPRRVFVNSMSDLFHPDVPDSFIDRVFATIERAERHTFQVLTKRPERMAEWSETFGAWPANAWAGVSVESQEVAERLEWLALVPAPVRFASIEPLLGPVRLPDVPLDWVIVGGESGQHFWRDRLRDRRFLVDRELRPRPERADWVRSIRDQCRDREAAFFFKQWGGPTGKSAGADLDGRVWKDYPAPAASPQLVLTA